MIAARILAVPALAGVLVCSAPAWAQAAASDVPVATGQVIRLSPEEKEALLAQGSEEKVDAAQAQALGGDGPSRQIHGEVGFMVGTGGARGFYGAAAIPLGDNASAFISFEDTRWGNVQRFRR